jgi:ankyrin repeat protein
MLRRALLLALFLAAGILAAAGVRAGFAANQPPALPSAAEALHQAVRDGNLPEVQRLVNNGANVNSVDSTGSQPLLDAALSGRLEIAGFLLARGADPDARNTENGATALQYAIISSRTAVVQLLLTSGAHANSVSRDGQSMLHLAASKDNQAVVQLLLDAHADIAALDADQRTPLESAILHNQARTAALLAAKGADVKHVHAADGRGPLHEACIKGIAALIQPLVEAGANPVQRDRSGQTPLDLALAYKNENVVAVLLHMNPRQEGLGGTVDEAAREAMETATVRGQTEIARQLIEAGFDINQPTAARSSYLNDAALKGQKKVAQLFLDHGANLEARNAQGGSPLHDAALAGSAEVIMLLLDRGAKIDARDREAGATPLMLAASLGKVDALALLLKRGASPTLRDNHGRTALDRAKEAGSTETIRLLVAATTGSVGNTPHGL